MLALGINKQMDLQSLLTAVARYFAKEQGWYEQRRQFQLLFIKSVLASATLTIVFLIWYMRDALKNNALAICGICFLAAFIAIRASSFHHVDIFINTTVLNVRFNWIMELSGIFFGYFICEI
ncbi:hypothetical protein [Methylocucumis oryzae]|uniref:hypothetical protein n=1 Tax=Methylocucumis oryzae TaxID=1632867 RepID=UPI00103FA555|nr:hypothetical protein [Methylocucumis oryzae]